MKTEVNMERKLLGEIVFQRSKSGLLSVGGLLDAGNKYRLKNNLKSFNFSQWLENDAVKNFAKVIADETGSKAIIKGGRGRNSKTWLHPYLFLDLAFAIDPIFKFKTYKWFEDNLLKIRDNSGDSYKEMSASLYKNIKNTENFKFEIINIAKQIKEKCGVEDWQTASEQQLEKRDKMHKEIALLADVLNNNDKAVEIAFNRC